MYKLKPLQFNYQDLEPYIDTHTMGLHYHKHQQNYLNNLNKLLIENNFSFSYPIEEIYEHIQEFEPKDQYGIIFNLGGVINHNIYWESINPNNKKKPEGKLLESIIKNFQSIDNFKKEFIKKALGLKGSGYTFLVKNKNNNLEIINTLNQDSPLLFGYTPLLNIDMWEHAYYLNYKNNKQEYLDNFFEIINFNHANKLFNNILTAI